MAQAARARRAVPVLPDEVLVWDIFVRLPAKALLRCRAVCRSWRRLTSAPDFLHAHHKRQPFLPLVEFVDRALNTGSKRRGVDDLDLRRSPVERLPVLRFNNYITNRPYRFHASCDGLLILSLGQNGFFYICNPTTRQWISLARCCVLGLYQHNPSREYGILYRNEEQNDATCYVLTVGSSMAPRGVGKYRASGLCYTQGPSVLQYGSLHWVHSNGTHVLVFDTAGETFRWMRAPIDDQHLGQAETRLVQMDDALGISRISSSRAIMKLWMLQSYEGDVWLMKYEIVLPVLEIRSITGNFYLDGMVLSYFLQYLICFASPAYMCTIGNFV